MKVHKKLIATLATLMLVVGGLLVPAVPASAALAGTVLINSAASVSATPGASATISGTGFTALATGGVVNFTNSATAIATTVASAITVSGTGTFSVSVIIPALPRGTYSIAMTGDSAIDTTVAGTVLNITPSITISAFSVNSGDTIFVSGQGFVASATVTLSVDSTSVTSTTTASNGTFTNASMTLPATLAAGSHAVFGTDSSGASPITTITLAPKMTIASASVAVGSALNVAGTAFAASSQITFYMDGTIISGSANTDSNGAFTGASVTVPPVAGGSHTIRVQDSSGNSDSTTFTVTSKSTITPVTGPAGTSVSISGNGFTANVPVTVKYNGADVVTVPAAITSDASGNVAGSFKTPSGPSAAYPVTISDGTNTNTATFTSVATAKIDPVKGNTGSSVQVSGAGYKASATVTVTYNNVTAGSTSSDTNGNFTSGITIPNAPTGDHTMTISDGTNSISQTFSITPSATMDPLAGFVGTVVTIKGSGFTALRGVSVKYDQVDAVSPAPTTDANGTFTVAVKVPASKGGNHVIVISDGVNTQNFTFAMDSTAPVAPAPQLPLTGTQAEALPSLKWSDVTDQSAPTTYNLQLSDDAAFAHLIVDKTGLTVSSYTITTDLPNRSKQKPYYWRVQAVDAASNVSAWSNASTFFVGFVLQSWALYTIFAVVALILGVLGFWLGKRRAMSM